MGTLTRVTAGGRITLPPAVLEELGLEKGDSVEIELMNGVAVLRPESRKDLDQAYFWTEQWQEAEKEATEDLAAGRVKIFDSAVELVKELHGRTSAQGASKLRRKPGS